MFSASKLARSAQGPIAMRLQYLAMILILVAPFPSRCQEAAATPVKQPVQAESGEQRYRVIVWPEGPEGTPTPDRYDMHIQGRRHSSSRVADGGYLIPNIPPGHCKLVSVAWSGAEYLGEGYTSFDVTDADVTLHLTLGGLGEIQGVVRPDGALAKIPAGVMVGIESHESGTQGLDVDATGQLMIDRVLPGEYEFKLFKNPDGVLLRSVRCGGAEVTAETPLRVGDRQKITGCEIVLGREDPKPKPPPEPASNLVTQFESTTDWKQLEVAEKIVALDDTSVLPDLESSLSSEDMHVRGNAAFIFASLGDDRGFQAIKEILEDRSTSTKRAVHQVDDAGQPSTEVQILYDRTWAVYLFGKLKDPRAVPILVPLLNDDQIDWGVASSLRQIGDKSAIPPLIATLRDGDPSMRVLAIDALVQLDEKEALPELRALLGDNEKIHFGRLGTVAESAKSAIAKLEATPQ